VDVQQQFRMKNPTGVAIDSTSKILVVDSGNHRVQVFSRIYVPIHCIGYQGNDTGQFSYPEAIAVDPFGKILVTGRSTSARHIRKHIRALSKRRRFHLA